MEEVSLTIPDRDYNSNSMPAMAATARIFAMSGMFPDARTQAQAYVKILAGKELGLPAIFSMTKIHLIQGVVTAGSEIMAAKIKSSNKYDYKVISHDQKHCKINFYKLDQNNSRIEPAEYESIFTLEDAERAGLIKAGSNWAKWPRAMLFSKALSQGARIVCPEVINGIYTPEDLGQEEPLENAIIQIEPEPETSITFGKWLSQNHVPVSKALEVLGFRKLSEIQNIPLAKTIIEKKILEVKEEAKEAIPEIDIFDQNK